jgi:hypothetical protein
LTANGGTGTTTFPPTLRLPNGNRPLNASLLPQHRDVRNPGELRNVHQGLGRYFTHNTLANRRQITAAGVVVVDIVREVHAGLRHERRERPAHAEQVIAAAAFDGLGVTEDKGRAQQHSCRAGCGSNGNARHH